MKLPLLASCLIGASGLALWPANGQDLLAPPPADSPNRLGANFRAALNISASFKTGFGLSAPPPPSAGSGIDRNYDDGYARVDNINNAGGYTHYWGYDSDSQHDAVNHTITMHRAAGAAVSRDNNDPMQVGCEITYNRELGRKKNFRWGIETALNYMNVSARSDRPAAARGTLTSDTYALPPLPGGGYVVPPPAPYHGLYDSTGIGNPAIYDTPSERADHALTAVSSGMRDFNADIIGWRVGPYVEIPAGTNLVFLLSGGFSLVGVLSDYRFNETVSYFEPGSSTDLVSLLPVSGAGSHAALLAGGYLGGGILLQLEQGWNAYGGVQWQYAGNYVQREGLSEARLDLSKSIFISVGATYSF